MLDERWHMRGKGEVHDVVVSLVDALAREQEGRETRALHCMSLFEGRALPELHPAGYYRAKSYGTDAFDELYWNIPRSLCQTVQAKIAGRQKPKPQFVTSGADWATKRRAKKLDRFAEGQLSQTQGIYSDAWELGCRVFLDASVFGLGVIKVFADTDNEQVTLERTFHWELYVDPQEARYGQPQNLFHCYAYDRDKLIQRFPSAKEKLMACERYEDDMRYGSAEARVADQLEVYEAWRLPIGPDKPGRHVICVKNVTLLDEEYDRPEFPFVWLHWSRELMGFGSTSLIEEVDTICEEVNTCVARMQDAVRLSSLAVCLYEEGTIPAEALRTNEDAINIPYLPNAKNPPQWVSPQAFSEAMLTWVKLNREQAYSIPGVSEMSATSRKEARVTAGVALRTLSNMESERFSVIFRQYENMYVALARHIIECTRVLAEANPDFAVRWPGKGFLQEIRWEDVDLPADQYVIQIESVSGMKNTPADRLQLAQDMFGAGIWSGDAFARVVQTGDVESEFDQSSKQRELIGKYIESWLDATPEKLASGEFRFYSPIPFMNLEDALVQVAGAYLDAQLDEADSWNCEFFLRYMTELDKQIQDKAQRMAEIEARAKTPLPPPPGAMPPGPPPPMPAPAPPIAA